MRDELAKQMFVTDPDLSVAENVASDLSIHLSTVDGLDMDNAGDGESVLLFYGASGGGSITVNMLQLANTAMQSITAHSEASANARISALEAENAELRKALTQISLRGGNLSDEALTSKTGGNDAVSRGLMYVDCRDIALAALPTPPAEETKP